MKKVIIFDSYRRVYDEEGALLHDAENSETIAATGLSFEAACYKVAEIFEDTKLLGDSYNIVVGQPDQGVVEIQVEFTDKKFLHRVVYLKDV